MKTTTTATAQHTPGPWETKGTAGHETHGQSAVYGDANARLIAAAPELLAALKLAASALDASAALRRPGWEEELVIVREARAAIAKATTSCCAEAENDPDKIDGEAECERRQYLEAIAAHERYYSDRAGPCMD